MISHVAASQKFDVSVSKGRFENKNRQNQDSCNSLDYVLAFADFIIIIVVVVDVVISSLLKVLLLLPCSFVIH